MEKKSNYYRRSHLLIYKQLQSSISTELVKIVYILLVLFAILSHATEEKHKNNEIKIIEK